MVDRDRSLFNNSSITSFEIDENVQQVIRDSKEYLIKLRKIFNTKMESNNENLKRRVEDFCLIRAIGKGAFGSVKLVKSVNSEKQYVIKEIRTRNARINFEKDLMSAMSFPFVVNLIYFCKDYNRLYLVMAYSTNGDLFALLRKLNKFDEHLAKFYAAQVLMAIEYLHFLDIIYRDLKPENILLSREGYIRLTDFGFSKHVSNRTYTLCGTPDYIAPEILLSRGYGKSVDYWAFGVLLYEFNTGFTPFYGKSDTHIFSKILTLKYRMQDYFTHDLKNLINNLLTPDVSKRYGMLRDGFNDIKNHHWFHKLPWLALLNKAVKPPYLPYPANG